MSPVPGMSDMLQKGLQTYVGPMNSGSINHLLRRTLFGVTKADFSLFQAKGDLSSMIASLFSKPQVPGPPIVNYTDGKDIKEPTVADGKTWINEAWDDKIEYYRLLSLKTWWINLALYDQTITEKMIMFWHNHIPVEMVGVFHARQSYDYLSTLRKHALGNFKQLVKDLTKDPMMLFYLNGNSNDKTAPDENYARELQELFCIGKGPNAKFTEEDIKAAAKVLTGWKSDYLKPKTFFAAWAHDTSDKRFSSFYGETIIKGRAGDNGMTEMDELIDMIVGHPECALYICRKIYTYFVYPEISEQTEINIIQPLAKLFKENNYEILPVLQTLLSSEHFFDPLLRLAMIKSPMDYILGANRHFQMRFPQDLTEYKSKFKAQTVLYYFLTSLQQDIGDPPNVSGWPAYYQYPQFDKSWISTHTIHERGNHSELLVWYGYQMGDKVATIDWVAYIDSYPRAADPNYLIEDVLNTLFTTSIDPSVKVHLKSILLSGQLTDYYWTSAWSAWKANVNDTMFRNTVEIRLKLFFQYILQMDEFQLM